MKRSLVVLTLIVASVFFFSACDRAKQGHHGHGLWGKQVIEKISSELDLTAQQRATLESIQNDFKAMHKTHANQRQTWIQGLVAEVKKDRVDPKKLEAMVEARATHQREMIQKFSTRLSDFHASLNSKQKETLAQWIEKWGSHMGPK